MNRSDDVTMFGHILFEIKQKISNLKQLIVSINRLFLF